MDKSLLILDPISPYPVCDQPKVFIVHVVEDCKCVLYPWRRFAWTLSTFSCLWPFFCDLFFVLRVREGANRGASSVIIERGMPSIEMTRGHHGGFGSSIERWVVLDGIHAGFGDGSSMSVRCMKWSRSCLGS